MTYPIGKDTTYLGLGEIAIEKAPRKLKTDLGSCVAVTLYDPAKKIGGMAHIVLPKSDKSTETKFANNAIPALLKEMTGAGCKKEALVCNVIGGSNKFDMGIPVNLKNLIEVSRILEKLNINVSKVDVGGQESRIIIMDLNTGTIKICKLG